MQLKTMTKSTLIFAFNIESSKVCIKGDLTSKALKVKTSEFYIKKGVRKKYEVASQENFEIYANWFRRYKTAY